jgi:ribose 5-phosphate isomerase A
MWIIDAPFEPLALVKSSLDTSRNLEKGDGENGIWTAEALVDRLIKIPGVAEIGLFCGAQKPVDCVLDGQTVLLW